MSSSWVASGSFAHIQGKHGKLNATSTEGEIETLLRDKDVEKLYKKGTKVAKELFHQYLN